MNDRVRERFAKHEQMESENLIIGEGFDITLVDTSSERQLNKGKQFLLQFPSKLEWAPQAYKCDKDLLLQLLQHDPCLVRFASDSIQSDWGLWLNAVQRNPKMCRYVPTRLWTKDTILAAAKLCTKDTISNITNIVRTVYQGSPDSNPFSNIHREIALEIIGKVESNSMCRDLVDAWSGDAELILKAMHVDFTLVARCSNELKSNSDFIRQAVAITPDVYTTCQVRVIIMTNLYRILSERKSLLVKHPFYGMAMLRFDVTRHCSSWLRRKIRKQFNI